MTTIENTEVLLETCIKVNKRTINGYGAIAGFVKKLVGLDVETIESILNDALRDSGYNKDECRQLNAAYQMAARRNLEDLVFGVKFDTELQHGIFYIPDSRSRKSDKLTKLFKEWKKDVSDHNLTVKLMTEIVKANKKATKSNEDLIMITDMAKSALNDSILVERTGTDK